MRNALNFILAFLDLKNWEYVTLSLYNVIKNEVSMKSGITFKHNNVEYVFRALNLTQMKSQLNKEFENKFFSRSSRKFHRDIKHYWSASRQVLVITRLNYKNEKELVEYCLIGNELGKLELRLIS